MPAQPHLAARPRPLSAPAADLPPTPETTDPLDATVTGLQTLPMGGVRESYVYVPPQYDPAQPMPMALLLHGAGGRAHDGLRIFLHLADQDGLILVAPASKASSWDIINRGVYGPDVDLIDRTLEHAFAHYTIDPERVAIGGFSDGASYALTLGLANGDLFSHVIAFSPGFIGPLSAVGTPKVFISHGRRDDVLPIDACSRTLVPTLQAAEYDLVYHEFSGGHVIPPEEARFAMDWFTGSGPGMGAGVANADRSQVQHAPR